ncbi:AraC family transcriptional regulator [Uliginosibacterium sp. 31-16]|uniref:helix-turn-helix domain-containing protein n=1 Tax=Uliginosibacterium sp. 31-16 TaxID=3068315 RepID=UPI00273EFC41|nr:AraC family transcriptional regulator [Uliginosibacterium sp. 31-16]MDP5239902.1 AraC family transcriptional regulator [Uliginosibacterium sp. 31-16]
MTVELFSLQSRRVRSVIEHVGTHLDEDISLARLADLACLSPSQLERLYRSKVGETPLATLRRLRLARAMEQIRSGHGDLQDIGLAAGYGSGAAFTHAFVRQFGFAPSQVLVHAPVATPLPALYLERLPERPAYAMNYQGCVREQHTAAVPLVGNLAIAGVRRWRNWIALDRDCPLGGAPERIVSVQHFVPALGLTQPVAQIDRIVQEEALYAVWHTLRFPRAALLPGVLEEVRATLGCVLRGDARMLLREITVSGYTAPQERRFAVYLPVEPLKRRS